MNDALLGLLVSVSLVGIGVFLLLRDRATPFEVGAMPSQLRQGGIIGIVFGAVIAAFTVYLFLRGSK